MTRQPSFFTKRPGHCEHCERKLPVGSRVHLSMTRIRCLECGPWPAPHGTVTTIPPASAEGAVDSTRAHLKAKPQRGRALRTGVPMTPGKITKPKKRKRLTGNQRITKSKQSA